MSRPKYPERNILFLSFYGIIYFGIEVVEIGLIVPKNLPSIEETSPRKTVDLKLEKTFCP